MKEPINRKCNNNENRLKYEASDIPILKVFCIYLFGRPCILDNVRTSNAEFVGKRTTAHDWMEKNTAKKQTQEIY